MSVPLKNTLNTDGYTMVSVFKLTALLPLTALGLFSLTAVGGAPDSQAQSVPPDAWPAAQPAALDRATEAFVGQLLRQMSLREKIGQMIQADIASISPAELTQYKLGSILAGGNAAPDGDPRTTPQAWLAMTDTFYRAALAAKSGHPAIPIFFGIDAVHGNAKIIGATRGSCSAGRPIQKSIPSGFATSSRKNSPSRLPVERCTISPTVHAEVMP